MTSDPKKTGAALRGFARWVLLPILVVVGAFAIAAGLLEGPALQPFLYGVF